MNDQETKLTAARTRLILDRPFLGALVLRLPMIEADPQWCQTTATDARQFFYNRDYIAALTLEQTQFVLAHEALHCALSHFARRGHRVKFRWDCACDHAVNPLLTLEGMVPPPGVWVEESFKGMTAEEIYPQIDENNAKEPMDRHVYDEENRSSEGNPPPPSYEPREPDPPDPSGGGQGGGASGDQPSGGGAKQPPPLDAQEQQNLAVQWQQRLAGAAQQALQAGKLGGEMARLVEHLLQPQLPWRSLLARYLSVHAREDFNYARPSRREGEAIFPSLHSARLEVVVGIDTSGSVREREIREFLTEVDALKSQFRARVTLLPCDCEIMAGAPWVFEPWEPCRLPREVQGGGATRFHPVFEWVESQTARPDLVLYFTDAKGEFPKLAPPYPVLWLVKGREKVPWGQRVQLN